MLKYRHLSEFDTEAKMHKDESQSEMMGSLLNAACFPHRVSGVQLMQTHISWIILTGPYAYKIKKAVDLGFLDFSSLEKRKFLCEEELRLNRRFSPDLYLDVVTITGTADSPCIGGEGNALEYAVKMREFPQTALLSYQAERKAIVPAQVDQLATHLATFHREAARAGAEQTNTSPEETRQHGTFDAIAAPVRENFNQLRKFSSFFRESEKKLQWLERWSEEQLEVLKPVFAGRLADGFIRECHGDLHLGNIAVVDDDIRFFDCIEFNPAFRWIDTFSELAFLLMDLEDFGYYRYAGRLLNRYLELTGDYEGLRLLTFYKVYRAMVRVKVNAIRMTQLAPGKLGLEQNKEEDRQKAQAACSRYLSLAEKCINARAPFFAIMHGVSGTGKSTVSAKVADEYGAIRLRSDIERKRLHGLAGTGKTHSDLDAGLYSGDATDKTYTRLAGIGEYGISAGYPVIVDATFLSRMKRHDFMAIANRHQVPFVIFHCHASEATLVERLKKRKAMPGEASEADVAVMRHQLEKQNRLSVAEKHWTININTDVEFDPKTVLDALNNQGVKLISGKSE